MRLMLSAGEASGDNYGAMLLDALRLHEEIAVFGRGGEKMQAAGCGRLASRRGVSAAGRPAPVKPVGGIARRVCLLGPAHPVDRGISLPSGHVAGHADDGIAGARISGAASDVWLDLMGRPARHVEVVGDPRTIAVFRRALVLSPPPAF